MANAKGNDLGAVKARTVAERKSDRDLVLTRTFDAPARLVFEAWSKAELFRRWWLPQSLGMSLVACEMDVRTGGTYRLAFDVGQPEPMAFFGRYLEVVPNERIVWTNEEAEEGAVTTVTFEEKDGKTVLKMHELYPSKEALDAEIESGALDRTEVFDQLDALLATL